MKKEEPTKNYSYLKKDFFKLLLITGFLVVVIVGLSVLDLRIGFISILASKIMRFLVP